VHNQVGGLGFIPGVPIYLSSVAVRFLLPTPAGKI
jgi:hypothetical protein